MRVKATVVGNTLVVEDGVPLPIAEPDRRELIWSGELFLHFRHWEAS